MDEESIDDLRIAISEACTNAVIGHEEGGVEDAGDRHMGRRRSRPIAVEIAGAGTTQVALDESDVDTQGFSTRVAMSEALLKSLVDGYEVVRGRGPGSASP